MEMHFATLWESIADSIPAGVSDMGGILVGEVDARGLRRHTEFFASEGWSGRCRRLFRLLATEADWGRSQGKQGQCSQRERGGAQHDSQNSMGGLAETAALYGQGTRPR